MARRSKLGKPTRTGTTKKARTASAPIGAKQDGVGPNRALPVGQGAQPPGNAGAPSNVVLAVVSIDAFVAAAFDESSRPASGSPTAVIIMGPPAAGKTTLRKAKFTSGYVVIDSAEVFLRLCEGRNLDFPGELETPMELLGSLIAEQAVEERRNLVIEVVPVEDERALELINALNEAGYRTNLVHAHCSLEECYQRNGNRGPDDISAYFAERFHMRWLIDACRALARPG